MLLCSYGYKLSLHLPTLWPRKKIKKQHKVKEVMAVSIVIIIYYTDYIGLIHSVGLDFDLSILMSWWL